MKIPTKQQEKTNNLIEIGSVLKKVLEGKIPEGFFIWNEHDLALYIYRNQFGSNQKQFIQNHLLDICNGMYFIGSYDENGEFLNLNEL